VIDWLRRTPKAPAQPARRTLRVGDAEMPLVIRRLRNARQMTLRLSPDGSEVRISIPSWGRVGDAEAFARDRAPWLARKLAARPEAVAVEPGGHLPYRGEQLRIDWFENAPRRPLLDDGAVVVGGPSEGLAPRLQRWLEKEALRLMQEDLAFYCARAGETPPRLALSRAQRRWGSCSTSGVIRMNWRLVMAPDFVRRSVVAHEVAHLVHFDHSPAFQAALGAIYEGEVEQANRWLKAHGRGLYRLFG
jgi:predicted metal-dependent hydrolase